MRRFNLFSMLLFLACSAAPATAQEPAAETPAEPAAAAERAEEPAGTEPPAEEAPSGEAAETEVEIPAETPPDEPIDEPIADPPTDEAVAEDAQEQPAVDDDSGTDWAGLIERAPEFFAVLHRAAVHMPIALWTLGAFFVLVGVVVPSWRNQVPLACLIGGMLTAVGAAMTGWWNAEHEWGDEWAWADLSDAERFAEPIVQHRWMAVALVACSVILSVIALVSQRKQSKGLGFVWRVGLLALAAGVAWEGHLGGEMTVGEGYLEEALEEWISPEE